MCSSSNKMISSLHKDRRTDRQIDMTTLSTLWYCVIIKLTEWRHLFRLMYTCVQAYRSHQLPHTHRPTISPTLMNMYESQLVHIPSHVVIALSRLTIIISLVLIIKPELLRILLRWRFTTLRQVAASLASAHFVCDIRKFDHGLRQLKHVDCKRVTLHHISFRLGGWLDCSIIMNILISWHLFRCTKALTTLASRNIRKRATLIDVMQTTEFAHHYKWDSWKI